MRDCVRELTIVGTDGGTEQNTMSGNAGEYWNTIADSVPVLLSYIDRDLRYQWANQTYERWFGQNPAAIPGRHVREVLGEEAWQAVRPLMERALSGHMVSYEQKLPYRDSGPLWVRVNYTPDVSDGVVRGFSVVVHDIAEQKAAEERVHSLTDDLRARVEELQALFDVLPIGLFLGHDPACAQMSMNRAGAELFGVPPDTNPSLTSTSGDKPGFRVYQAGVEVEPEDLPMQRAARLGERILGEEVEVLREDGSRVLLWLFACPLYDALEQVRGSIGAFVDTTERKRVEEALRESESDYRALFEMASVGAAEVDPSSGRLLRVNQRFCDMLGYSEDELLARSFSDITHPDDRELDLARYRQALEGQGGWQNEKRYVRRGGQIVWALVTGRVVRREGRPLRTFAHIVDITAKKQAEDALREAEERFRVAQELSLDGFIILRAIRDDSGTIVDFRWEFANAAAARFLNLPAQDLVGRRLLGVLPNLRSKTDVFDRFVEVVQSGVPHDYELFYDADGVCGWFRNMGIKLGDGLAVSFSDVTERRKLEDELRNRVEELRREHQQKDEFIAMLAHELRNPLAPIRNAVEILHVRPPEDPTLLKMRDVIARQVEQLIRLVDDLLDLSRITRGTIELRMSRVEVRRVLETSQPLMDHKRHELLVDFLEQPAWVEGDLTRLAQVVANLLNNAAKYTEPGGHIHLSTGLEQGHVVIRVRDDGVGIPPEMLPHVFDMFSQVDGSGHRGQSGLGIGLTIVRRLVEMHGGRVEVTSAGLGKGSEFTVHLPLADAGSTGQEKNPRLQDGPKLRILVVDDNVDAAQTLAELLRRFGHDVRAVFDGTQAVDEAQRRPPDVVLLDLGMPAPDGFEVARRLRSDPTTRGVYLVALTGWGEASMREQTRRAGFDLHLVKPPELDALHEALARAAVRRQDESG